MAPSGVAKYERMAVDYLWNWTGQIFGTCAVAIRPCRQNCAGSPLRDPRRPFTPALIGGEWYNLACGSCGDQCGCSFTPQLVLPGPVVSIDEILINGSVLSPSAYRLDNNRWLTRLDGHLWPTCQNLTLDTDQPGTWEISYTVGVPVPTGGQIAAGVLTRELALAACNDKACSLPARIKEITRQGVTVAVVDSFDDIDKGHTGIWIIDSWIASITKTARRSAVYSPDISRRAPMRSL